MAANARELRKVSQMFAVRKNGLDLPRHPKSYGQRSKNAAGVLQETGAEAHERLPCTQQVEAQAHARPTKGGWRTFSPKILLCKPLLEWYLDHGLKITLVNRTIDYVLQKVFKWFVNKATENRRKGDHSSELALSAKVFKLLGNSSYGTLIKALERPMTVKYTASESVLRKVLRLVWF